MKFHSIEKLAPLALMIGCLFVAFGCAQAIAQPVRGQDWPQWGGPRRDFKSDSTGLAGRWPARGPQRLWSRPLGEGHSAIVAEGGRLYTMYRKGQQEIVVSLDSKTGKTIWEYNYDGPYRPRVLLGDRGENRESVMARQAIFAREFPIRRRAVYHPRRRRRARLGDAVSQRIDGSFKGRDVDQPIMDSPYAGRQDALSARPQKDNGA